MFIEKYKGFEIHLEILDEDTSPDNLIDWKSSEEREEFFSKLESGKLYWFCAKVSAKKADIELAAEYLGGCDYKSISDFLKDNYYHDMREEVINEAKEKIKKLNEVQND